VTAVLDTGRDVPLERVALVDLLDRLLAGGVVITGDLVISIAEVDLVQVSLRALVTSIKAELLPEEDA
jgi:Gas vesicle protein